MDNPLSNLMSGSDVRGGESPQQRVAHRKEEEKLLTSDVAKFAVKEGLVAAEEKYQLSESAIVKMIINRAKRDNLDLTDLLPLDRQNEIQQFIFEVHTTSVKKLLQASEGEFSEGEIRLVRAIIQRQDSDTWEF